jgi:uncharacterized membrane protein HdeD (DUF308 family)
MSVENLKDSMRRYHALIIATSVLMIIFGIVAIALPTAAGIGVSLFVSWLIILVGFAHLAYAFAARSVGGVLWRSLLGIAYVCGGVFLAFHPALSLASLTLVLVSLLFAEGFLQIFAFFSLRGLPGSGWILFDGIVTLLLGSMIGLSWPSASAWAIGTIVGVNFLFSGFTRLGYGATAGKLLKA